MRIPKLMTNISRNIIDILNLNWSTLEIAVMRDGTGELWDEIFELVSALPADQLGVLAACGEPWGETQTPGRTAMYEVH